MPNHTKILTVYPIGGSLSDYCAEAVISAFDGVELRIDDGAFDEISGKLTDHIQRGTGDGEMTALYPDREIGRLQDAGVI